MTETQKRELEAFLADQKQIGGLAPSKVSASTVVWVETATYIVKLTKLEDGKFVVNSASPQVTKPPICCEICSYHRKLNHAMSDYLGKGMELVLKFVSGTGSNFGEIEGVSISGNTREGQPYEYRLWEN